LNLFIGTDAADPKRVKLMDLTPGAEHREFSGANAEEAVQAFDDGNEYPKGKILFEIPQNKSGIAPMKRWIETDGETSLSTWASRGGLAALGLGLAGVAATLIPGAQVAAPYLFISAAAAGAAASAASITNELRKENPSTVNITIDVLMIASSVLGAGAAFGTAIKGTFIATKAGRFLIYTGFALDAGGGVLIGAQGVSTINATLGDDKLSRDEKIARITRILANLALQGGLLIYGAKNLKGGGNAEAAQGGRVRSPKAGLYEGVQTSRAPKGWTFQDAPIKVEPDGTKTLTTRVLGPNGETGTFERAYNPATKKLELLNAFLEGLPKWVDSPTPLVAGKGIPTNAYVTMYQMRKLGVGFGGLKTVKMSTIQNIEAILQLESLKRQGVALEKAILMTHSVEYAETSIIQSGHEIVSAKVDVSGAWTDKTIGFLMSHFEAGDAAKIAKNDALLQKYGLKRSDKMLMNYDILLSVKPLSPGSNAQPLSGSKK
jgi:hypothetical protein